MESLDLTQLAAGLAIAMGVFGPAIGIGLVGYSGLQAVGRNPDASNKIQPLMILGMAFAEALGIYALVVALIILFVA